MSPRNSSNSSKNPNAIVAKVSINMFLAGDDLELIGGEKILRMFNSRLHNRAWALQANGSLANQQAPEGLPEVSFAIDLEHNETIASLQSLGIVYGKVPSQDSNVELRLTAYVLSEPKMPYWQKDPSKDVLVFRPNQDPVVNSVRRMWGGVLEKPVVRQKTPAKIESSTAPWETPWLTRPGLVPVAPEEVLAHVKFGIRTLEPEDQLLSPEERAFFDNSVRSRQWVVHRDGELSLHPSLALRSEMAITIAIDVRDEFTLRNLKKLSQFFKLKPGMREVTEAQLRFKVCIFLDRHEWLTSFNSFFKEEDYVIRLPNGWQLEGLVRNWEDLQDVLSIDVDAKIE